MRKPWKVAPAANYGNESPKSPTRSKTDSRNIRGRISGPIPIASPTEGSFPVRQSSLLDSPATFDFQNFEPNPQSDAPDVPHGTLPNVSETHPLHGFNRSQTAPRSVLHTRSRSSPIAPPRRHVLERNEPQPQPQSRPRHIRDSMISTETGGSKDRPQRKKSTLRGAIGKLFGRRKKSLSPMNSRTGRNESKTVQGSMPQHHRSSTFDVNMLSNAPELAQKRSASVPPGDYGRALRSHSIGPEDRLAIESARISAQADPNAQVRRRYHGSNEQSLREIASREGEPTGLTPRPVTVYGGTSNHGSLHEASSGIGYAITSDYTGLKRRSRSLSAIDDTATEVGDVRRSRSTDIRYWRQSQDPALKSPGIASHIEEIGNHDGMFPDITTVEQVQSPTSPLQSFTFGEVHSVHHNVEPKSTHRANMDARLESLERRMRRLEKSITESPNPGPDPRFRFESMHAPPVSYKPAATAMPWQGPTWFDSNTRISSRPSTGLSVASSKSSLDLGLTYRGSNRRLTTQPPLGFANRPLSTATIRGVASLPSISQEYARPLTTEHYITLMALLETERSARQALEAQIKTMGYQISVMAKSLNGFGPSKPSISEQSAFDYDDEDEDEEPYRNTNIPAGQTIVTQDSGIVGCSREEDEISGIYVTPVEEAEDQLVMRGKATRNLSLSAMTATPLGPELPHEVIPSPI